MNQLQTQQPAILTAGVCKRKSTVYSSSYAHNVACENANVHHSKISGTLEVRQRTNTSANILECLLPLCEWLCVCWWAFFYWPVCCFPLAHCYCGYVQIHAVLGTGSIQSWLGLWSDDGIEVWRVRLEHMVHSKGVRFSQDLVWSWTPVSKWWMKPSTVKWSEVEWS